LTVSTGQVGGGADVAGAPSVAMERHVVERHVVDGIEIIRRGDPAKTVPIVLLHGIGSNAASFEPIMACLDRSRAVIAWDCPGYGRSAPLAVEWPLATGYSDALVRLLDRLAVHRAVVIGHSLGAIIAARFAATNSTRTAAVALISPAVGYRVTPGAPMPDGVRARVDELGRLGPKDFAASRARGLVHEPDRKPEVTGRVEAAMAAVRLPGYTQAARMLASAWIFDDVATLQAPTLVMCGAHDRVTPPEQTGRVAHAVPPHVRVENDAILIADAGHAVPQERPQDVAERISGLINAHVENRHV
jgi:pimeloyl-ACP methyl ester carboxylesterase